MTLQRIVIEMKSAELVLRVLYRSKGDANPVTKGRRREVEELAKSSLRDVLEALEDDAECVGTSGFTTREDVLLATTTEERRRSWQRTR